MIYDIVHSTEYRFRRPVKFGIHRLTFRPRDSHDMRVLSTELACEPEALSVDLVLDVYGNSVALVKPGGPSERLLIESRFTVEHMGSLGFELPAEAEAHVLPPAYSVAERLALTPYLLPSFDDPQLQVRAWARSFVGDVAAPDARSVIQRMTAAMRESFSYARRDEEGTQTPLQTLELGTGACRDLATLMIDGLRLLGIAARFVSGYIYSPGSDEVQGGGATHAWVQVFLPDCGWFPVDPTNNLIGGADLIRVAVARQASEVSPLAGEWYGQARDFADMAVKVTVTARS
ncbi:MAG: transglutaminase family protein [Rhizobacter sp.]